ncbi:MAG: 3'-5' exonuclease [Pseudomonadota bacterium]|nr:3'-5' exonuclease [Pseudomonadota bacterium]
MLYLGKPVDQPQRDNTRNRADFFQKQAAETRDLRLKRYYQAGIVAPETPIGDVPLLAMDFETTGLDPKQNGIVSIGLVPMRLDRIQCHQIHYWILKPRFNLRHDSIVIHGITHSAVADAPDLLSILDTLLQQMAGHVMVVHHAGIERQFLDAALKARIGEGIHFPVIDTMSLEARLYRHGAPSFWQKLLGQPKTSIRLADSRTRYGLPHYRPHHAVTDALACAELLQAQVAHRFAWSTPISELWD